MNKYICETCNFKTNKLSKWKRHKKSKKHGENSGYKCIYCDEVLKSKTSYYRHVKKCKEEEERINHTNDLLKFKKLRNEILKEEDSEEIIKLPKRVYEKLLEPNVQNNYVNINLFLDEKCKNAMNLNDFIDTIKFSLNDLKYTQKNGYAEGISNVLIKHLKDIEPKERPICCSDIENQKFYIKDKDKWNEDDENKKIKKSLSKLSNKQIIIQKKWIKDHPNWINDDKLIDEYNKLILELCKYTNEETISETNEKIIKSVSECVKIEYIDE